jgi:hypothetical protein
MMESDWLNATDPQAMLMFLRGSGRASDRKYRLAAAACCRRLWHASWDGAVRDAVEVAERFADGRATPEEMQAAGMSVAGRGDMAGRAAGACAVVRDTDAYDFPDVAHYAASRAFDVAVEAATVSGGSYDQAVASRAAERAAQAALLRELFGPLPFREVRLDLAWLAWNGGTVQRLAEGIYAERAFDRLPVLGDALEEAGCTDADILNHCRQPGVHVRGCWVIDLLLGKW